MKTISIFIKFSLFILTISLFGGFSFGGSPANHAFYAFQYLNKPLDRITLVDQGNALFSHIWTDGLIAENGKNLIYYSGAEMFVCYQKAKSIGMAKQYRMALLEGNLLDIVDKALTGGAIEYQLSQIPVVGEYVSLMVPHFAQNELFHSIPGYPQPAYSLTEEQYFWYCVAETTVFWFELDYLKVRDGRIYGEVKF